MNCCVIVGGADVNSYGFIRETPCTTTHVLFCDSGLKHLDPLQAKPSLIIGGLDSHENPRDAESIVFP